MVLSRLPRSLVFVARASSLSVALAACGGTDNGDMSLGVAWTFAAGDCASNGVNTVRVAWGPADGDMQASTFPCGESSGTLGEIAADGSLYTITSEGLDENGAVVAESYGTSATFSGGAPGGHIVELTLHPAEADLIVSWSLASGANCPQGVILPYFVTLYEAPANGATPTVVAKEAQETCSEGQVTLSNVAPGAYVVEIDSRALTPVVRGTAEVTMKPGQDEEVELQL